MSSPESADSASDDPAPSAPPEHVEAVDAFGRRVRIPREEYRSKVLPDLVKAHGSDPDRLAGVIMQAVRDGFAGDAIAAANRLTVVDKNVERALSVLAVVQRDAGELDAAEATLRELLEKKPGSPSAHVGLAMLEERRGNQEAGERLLWQALELDCNHADAVHAYLQTRHRAVGDAGYSVEVEKVAALAGCLARQAVARAPAPDAGGRRAGGRDLPRRAGARRRAK